MVLRRDEAEGVGSVVLGDEKVRLKVLLILALGNLWGRYPLL